MNTRILILAAIIMTVFTGMLIHNQWAQQQPAATVSIAPVVTPQRRILIARHELLPGNFIQSAQDLQWGEVSRKTAGSDTKGVLSNIKDKIENSSSDMFIHEGSASFADFNGSVVRHQLHAGEPILSSMLMKSDEGGFLSTVLAPGMCAVTIAVNATSGNGGFISPGNRIDLIATHRIKSSSNGSGDDQVVSEIVVHNIRVVAVDQMLDNPDNKAILAKTVTVEVSAPQAEQIAIAGERGKISVALLSNATGASSKTATADAREDNHTQAGLYVPATYHPVGSADPQTKHPQNNPANTLPITTQSGLAPHMQVIHGDQVQEVEFYREEP